MGRIRNPINHGRKGLPTAASEPSISRMGERIARASHGDLVPCMGIWLCAGPDRFLFVASRQLGMLPRRLHNLLNGLDHKLRLIELNVMPALLREYQLVIS